MATAPKMEITAPSVKLNISYQDVRTFQTSVDSKKQDLSAYFKKITRKIKFREALV